MGIKDGLGSISTS